MSSDASLPPPEIERIAAERAVSCAREGHPSPAPRLGVVVVRDGAIVAERAVPPHKQTHADIGYWLIGLVAVAQLVACKREVPLRLISAATARADILSNGHANKDDVIAWTIQQGWAPRDDHQADALLLLAHAHGMRAERRRKAA